jgi:predicted glutamine amidotransferase
MCELFCLSSLLPTVATISLRRFAEHGGPGGRSIDGWGLALFEGGDLRLYREPCPARDDPWLEFIQTRRIPSRLLISHIRHATHGAVTLANTQPFVREIAGRMHCFAHNGRLPCIEKLHSPAPAHYRPVGDTDSEYAACLLFESMAALWRGRQVPTLQTRLAAVTRFAARMREFGPANFLYSDGSALFAHGHRRMQTNGTIAPPGLWRLQRSCPVDPDTLARAGVHLETTAGPQRLALVASVPLTDEPWRPLSEGEVIVIEDGVERAPSQ